MTSEILNSTANAYQLGVDLDRFNHCQKTNVLQVRQ